MSPFFNIHKFFTLISVMMVLPFTGCIDTGGGLNPFDNSLERPKWGLGNQWSYAIVTPEVDVVTTMVVANINEVDYEMGAADLRDAQLHATLNYNPALGRVSRSNLEIYENGEPQKLFSFPLEEDKSWTFTLLGVSDFIARVDRITDNEARIVAGAPTGEQIVYTYSSDISWLTSLSYTNTEGLDLLSMTLIDYADDFNGEVHFLRAGDLYSEIWEDTSVDIFDTFISGHHSSGEEWDKIIFYLETRTADDASGDFILKDPVGNEAIFRPLTPNTDAVEWGSLDARTGEWQIQLALEGDSRVRLVVAGALSYSWNV
ncbi:MAG: hypothetical protein BEU04_05000 [Marine Group III euryarchaeote CG-Bathy1]|uniref:Uncharacterized protein n=1 Tax=Marine Group III euryarchaeote CG-Bathy1 TaxID=1889001 RepID=A0A1J5T5C7_9ARCH|nr:MAG: hypothetical protein BEU04_05000 [Marine Group III euryarchaeote CG-Bathy1]